ncbi:hypothetical protein GPECTOR_1g357 [Gonium pectorale]|uniref:cyclin-dependent kinase n=1 Tax=Gonium pectorale TaxID=33097 RepID=A0A150H2V1_GONPE|nr:hypothetical protein GPECTOR_1g357 [Gonium pectorale]|eukprot:KXZ56401.1 hypothetical protein GPECTOR_1g357 [Gonium pectorale]
MAAEFEYISTLGDGAYGEVWRCRERATGKVVAVKGFKQAHEDKEILRLAVREVKMLEAVDHPNVVKLLSYFKSKTNRVYLVFEYVESSLHDELDRFPHGLPSARAKLVAWQLLGALAYLHDKKIVHRDVKPTNILLGGDSTVKLCDFGFARHVRCGPRDVQECTSYVTTRWYRAPEVLVSASYGASADVWSAGVTIAEIATGRPLFPGESSPDQLWRILRCLGPLPFSVVSRMNPEKRVRSVATSTPPTYKSLRQRLPELEPALFELVQACLRLDPRQRPTVRELLQMPYFWDVPRKTKFSTPLTTAAPAGMEAASREGGVRSPAPGSHIR